MYMFTFDFGLQEITVQKTKKQQKKSHLELIQQQKTAEEEAMEEYWDYAGDDDYENEGYDSDWDRGFFLFYHFHQVYSV